LQAEWLGECRYYCFLEFLGRGYKTEKRDLHRQPQRYYSHAGEDSMELKTMG
jgi:hypothetical protein